MQEITKCPHCGKDPHCHYYWGGNREDSFYHCGASFTTLQAWNRYAAAIELIENEAWFKEVLDIRSYIGFDEKNPRSSKNEEYNRILEESSNDLNNAYERAIAMFK